MSAAFKSLRDEKLQQRAAALASAPPYVAETHGVFLKATAAEIVKHIQSGNWTATRVVEAYIARSAEAHAATNLATEVLYEHALKEAKALDTEFAVTKQLRGPLHGVPISFKAIDVAGFDSSMGSTNRIHKPAGSDSDITAVLRAAGAIPILKTNVPQTLFSLECSNPVFGATSNPNDSTPSRRTYSSGGSSGGEAALLAMDGAALGVGTDVAGSVRVPAALCGVYALKPTAGRVSVVGAVDPTPGYEGITSVAGPLGRSIDDLELFARLTFGIVGRSTTVAPVPFREQKLHEKLRFGYYLDYYLTSSPAARRAALSTVEALRKAGHECVEIDIPTPNEAFKIWAALSSADGYATLLESKGSDPIETALLPISSIPGRPWFVRRLLSWMVGSLFKDPQLADMMSVNGRKSVQELYQWTAKRNQYMAQFDREIWAEHHLDGIIAPMTAVPQFPHGSFQTIFQIVSATCLYNLLNLPAGVLPITRIDPSLDASTSNASSPSLEYKSTVEKALYAPGGITSAPTGIAEHLKGAPIYNPEQMAGMPVGVQVVGRRWEDEKVLGIMRVVEKAVGAVGFGPGSSLK